jgi:hypothetical protein
MSITKPNQTETNLRLHVTQRHMYNYYKKHLPFNYYKKHLPFLLDIDSSFVGI